MVCGEVTEDDSIEQGLAWVSYLRNKPCNIIQSVCNETTLLERIKLNCPMNRRLDGHGKIKGFYCEANYNFPRLQHPIYILLSFPYITIIDLLIEVWSSTHGSIAHPRSWAMTFAQFRLIVQANLWISIQFILIFLFSSYSYQPLTMEILNILMKMYT